MVCRIPVKRQVGYPVLRPKFKPGIFQLRSVPDSATSLSQSTALVCCKNNTTMYYIKQRSIHMCVHLTL